MRCTLHLNRAAAGYCCGCGNFYCEACLTLCEDGRNYCASCRKKLGKKPQVEEGPARDAKLAVKIIVRMKSGKVLKGSTYTLDPARSGFHFIRHGRGRNDETYVKYSDVKYVALVESFAGGRRSSPGEYQPKGSEVAVTFKDGERLDGYTLKHYSEKDARFSVIPRDPHDNRLSILVERSAVDSMHLGRIPKAQELRKLVANPVRRLILHFYWKHPSLAITIDDLAARLERTPASVERELPVFIEEGLIERVGRPADRQLKLSSSPDHIVRETVASMGREIEMLYFRRKDKGDKSRKGHPGRIRRR